MGRITYARQVFADAIIAITKAMQRKDDNVNNFTTGGMAAFIKPLDENKEFGVGELNGKVVEVVMKELKLLE